MLDAGKREIAIQWLFIYGGSGTGCRVITCLIIPLILPKRRKRATVGHKFYENLPCRRCGARDQLLQDDSARS